MRVRGGVGAIAGFGVGPAVDGAVTLQVGLREAVWSISLEARGDFPGSQTVGGGQASTWMLLGMLVPCLHLPLAANKLELLGCALLGGGAVFASGSGYAQNASQTSGLAIIGARAALDVPVSKRLALRAHADLLVALTRPDLTVATGTPPVTVSPPPASGAAGVALLVYFR
jgi:hypothetical protein